MALKFGSSFSCLAPSLAPSSKSRRGSQLSLLQARYGNQQSSSRQLRYAKGRSNIFLNQVPNSSKSMPKRQSVLFAVSEDQSQNSETIPDNTFLVV